MPSTTRNKESTRTPGRRAIVDADNPREISMSNGVKATKRRISTERINPAANRYTDGKTTFPLSLTFANPGFGGGKHGWNRAIGGDQDT